MDFPAYADLLVELKDFVLQVTLNRPQRKNALRMETISELIDVLSAADASDEARCVLLTGAGGFFSSGMDLKAAGGAGKDDPTSPIPLDPGGFPKLCLLLEQMGKPVVARVVGGALAGGMGLMMNCHICLAADDAQFGTPEIKRGLWPMMIMRPIFANLPRKKAVEMILTGRTIDAAEAERLGIITRAVPAARLDEEVRLVAETVAGSSPAIMRLGLAAMNRQFRMSSEEAYPYLEGQLKECAKTEDFKEGLMAFAQKRKPVWKGR
jgi:enoyl-CoA hydratase/carnithine racemase